MLSLLLALTLSDFPVSLPRELGHVKFISGQSTDRGIEIDLEYLNDTEFTFSAVGIECTLLDHRESVVTSDYRDFTNDGQGFAPGKRLTVHLIVGDHVGRGRRAECVITRAVKSEAQPVERDRDSVRERENDRDSERPEPARKAKVREAEEDSSPPAANECCRKCRGGTKPCGDDCIPEENRCKKKPGCACE